MCIEARGEEATPEAGLKTLAANRHRWARREPLFVQWLLQRQRRRRQPPCHSMLVPPEYVQSTLDIAS